MATKIDSRRIEQRRNWQQPTTPPRRRGEVVVAEGYGVRVHVNRRQLTINDGIGRDRQVRSYSRAEGAGLVRVVVLGGSGSISLDALRWLTDVGAALVCIDRDGRLLCTTGPDKSEAKLRRAQTLAPHNHAGVEVARYLLTSKLEGQRRLLDRLPADPYSHRTLARCLKQLGAAETVEQAVIAEAEAAAAYWRAWQTVPVRFRPTDRRKVPEPWQRFGGRQSPIGGGPRLAVTPAGAILNYLYALLEAETRLACLQLGLDPALAVIHADTRGRDSLPLDLMEAVRPNVDRYLLALLGDQVFTAADFHETQRGNCRLLPPLTHQLAETLPAWRQLVAPVAEHVAQLFVQHSAKPVLQPTPLTQANRRADRALRGNRTTELAAVVRPPKPERRCKRCGGPLPHRDRTYCDTCLPHFQHDHYQALAAAGRARNAEFAAAGGDQSHGGKAGQRRSASRKRHAVDRRAWEADHGLQTDPEWFHNELQPRLHDVSLATLAQATGLSAGYLSQVRRGLKTPHVRHWHILAAVLGLPPERATRLVSQEVLE
jgi:CRISPR-associated endonuclease Cas1